MNSGYKNEQTTIEYYDSDYPSLYFSKYKENLDSTFKYQGINKDVEKYLNILSELNIPNKEVLELCCGTGRISLPLANSGYKVTGVDILQGMLDKFQTNLNDNYQNSKRNISLVNQDITSLSLNKKFQVAILGFNALLQIADFNKQIQALKCINDHLNEDGILLLDIVNPFIQNFKGDSTPKAIFTRRNTTTGNIYTRFSLTSPINAEQVQVLSGWYDEILPNGNVKRYPYSMQWRLIFRYELEMMLAKAGFDVISISSGYNDSPLVPYSLNMFVQVKKKSEK